VIYKFVNHFYSIFQRGTQTINAQLSTGHTLSAFLSSTINCNSSTYVQHIYTQNASSETKTTITREVGVGDASHTGYFEGYKTLKHNVAGLLSLTSLKPEVFNILLHLIPDNTSRVNALSKENKLLICLMKLKLGISFSAIAAFFHVHLQTVSRIFVETLSILSEKTKSWIFWPNLETVQGTMPECFQKHYSE